MLETDHTLLEDSLEAWSQTVAARIADLEVEASRDRLFTVIESQESKVKESKQQLFKQILLLAEASQRVSSPQAILEVHRASRQVAIDELHAARAEQINLGTEANAARDVQASRRADLEKAQEDFAS